MREDRGAGRPRGFDEDEVLDTIMALFWARGYEAVSLADIMAATGLRKGSLYTAYGDKRAMYLKALARYEARHVMRAAARLVAQEDGAAALEGFLAEAAIPPAPAGGPGEHASDRPGGCFLCNAAIDQAALDAEAAALVRKGFERLEAAIGTTLGLADRSMPQDERRARAAQILTTYAGLRVLARTGADPRMLAAARAGALAPALS